LAEGEFLQQASVFSHSNEAEFQILDLKKEVVKDEEVARHLFLDATFLIPACYLLLQWWPRTFRF
jgi:hypothetical protein